MRTFTATEKKTVKLCVTGSFKVGNNIQLLKPAIIRPGKMDSKDLDALIHLLEKYGQPR